MFWLLSGQARASGFLLGDGRANQAVPVFSSLLLCGRVQPAPGVIFCCQFFRASLFSHVRSMHCCLKIPSCCLSNWCSLRCWRCWDCLKTLSCYSMKMMLCLKRLIDVLAGLCVDAHGLLGACRLGLRGFLFSAGRLVLVSLKVQFYLLARDLGPC